MSKSMIHLIESGGKKDPIFSYGALWLRLAVGLLAGVAHMPMEGSPSTNQTIYFIVAQPPYLPPEQRTKESFVIGLNDPEKIQIARNGMAKKNIPVLVEGMVVFFNPVFQTNRFNRSYYEPGAALWTWYPDQVSLSDGTYLTAERLPSDLERRRAAVDTQTTAYVYNFRVVAELGPLPLEVKLILSPDRKTLRWRKPADAWEATAEYTPSLDQPWKPIPGPTWPTQTNVVSLPSLPSGGLFRVVFSVVPQKWID